MSVATTRYTEEEYFQIELASELKHEYVNGEIIEMVGGSLRHDRINGNLFRMLGDQFDVPGFHVIYGSVRIRVPAPLNYFYPDAAVVRGTPECLPNKPPTVVNPTVVFEILSPSTERFNRGEKLRYYQQIDSLAECVLISQETTEVERITRTTAGEWVHDRFTNSQDIVRLESLVWGMPVSGIYRKVDFSEPGDDGQSGDELG